MSVGDLGDHPGGRFNKVERIFLRFKIADAHDKRGGFGDAVALPNRRPVLSLEKVLFLHSAPDQHVRLGVADSEGLPYFKRIASRIFYRVFSFLSGVRLEPGVADFRLLDRQVVNTILEFRDEGLFLRGIVHWVGPANIQASGADLRGERATPQGLPHPSKHLGG